MGVVLFCDMTTAIRVELLGTECGSSCRTGMKISRLWMRICRLLPTARCVGMMTFVAATLSALLSLDISKVHAQNVRGFVINEATQTRMAGVEILLVDRGGAHIDTTLSDSTGSFVFECNSGRYSFQIRQVGLVPTHTSTFRLRNDTDTLDLAVVISPQQVAVLMPAVAVETEAIPRGNMRGFYQRQLDGFGYFLDQEEIERHHPVVFTDVFRAMTGIRLESQGFGRGRIIRMRIAGLGGGCSPEIFVNGVLMPWQDSPDNFLSPNQVAGIEVYKGPATIPERFKVRNSACGVIVVWTR